MLLNERENAMDTLRVTFLETLGKIKPMNAVNNGPLGMSERGTTNFPDYKALDIPYARNHDASFYSGFGGEHTVDVHRIFRNFDADVNDPSSYDFACTAMRVFHNCQTAGFGICVFFC